jgi:NAD(P)-dependent dehydrogenase (short-subunit alcohol dehydrogenase family)
MLWGRLGSPPAPGHVTPGQIIVAWTLSARAEDIGGLVETVPSWARPSVAVMGKPVVLVVGAGPGVGGSVARRFGRDGYDVLLVGRHDPVLEELGQLLESEGVGARWSAVDITDGRAFSAAVSELGETAGRIDVLHFNPSAFRQKTPLELTPEELAVDVTLGVGALLTAVQAARPFMSAGGRVTATGSMAADKPWNEAASLGVQKAGLRNLIHSIDTTLRPDGIRAVSVTVRGTLAGEGAFTPARVAEAIFAAAAQDEGDWRTEIPYTG